MEQTKSTYCRLCEPNCGLLVTLRDGRIVKVAGDPRHPVSKGFICARGKASLEIHHDPDRVRRPLRKVDGKWVEVGWDQALSDIGSRLAKIRREHGNDAVGLYFGNPLTFDFAFSMYLPLVQMTMATPHVYSSGSQDCNNKFAAARAVYGSPLLHPVPDMDKIELLIILGSNPAVSQMSFLSLPRPVEKLLEIEKRGGRVILVDPCRTETARLVGEHIFIRPDTDVYLLLSMIHVILEEGLYNQGHAAARLAGLDELKRLVKDFPPERAAGVTGIDAYAIAHLTRDFARAERAGIHASLGINLGSHGTLCYWLVQCLNALTGRLDRRGSMIFCQGLVDMAALYKGLPGRNKSLRRSRVGSYPVVMGTMPAGVMADEITTPGPGQLKALIVAAGNPLLTVPDQNRLARALPSLELLVSIDLYQNETGALGEYVLPGTDFYERMDASMTGLMFGPTRFFNYTEPVVEPSAECRHSWIIMHDILKAAGYRVGGKGPAAALLKGLHKLEEVFHTREPLCMKPGLILRAMCLFGGVSFKQLRRSPQGLLLGEHRTGEFFDKTILTPDHRVQLAPPEYIQGAAQLSPESDPSRPHFKLIGRRTRRTHNSWMHNAPSLGPREDHNPVLINPADAARLGVSEGDRVRIATDGGAIEVPVKISDDVMEGVVALGHGWGHGLESGWTIARAHPGVNMNVITPAGAGALEPFAGMARLTGISVQVTRADKSQGET